MVDADKVKKVGKWIGGAATLIASVIATVGVGPVLLEKIWPKNQPPIAKIIATKQKGTVPLEITFDGAKSSDPEGGSLKYYWLIDTGSVSEKISYHHVFTQPGEYSVVLKVEDEGGRQNQDSVIVEALPSENTNSTSSPTQQTAQPADVAKLQENHLEPLIEKKPVSPPIVQHSVDPVTMTAAHNQWRSKVDAPNLKWSDKLEMDAQAWTDHLKEINNCAPLNSNKGFSENIYRLGAVVWSDGRRESSKIEPQEVVQKWGKDNSGYSNIVDKEVANIGCAMSFCEDKSQVWVCYYSLPESRDSN
ncbi:CAP domain-containing protein [Candidatus Electronema sp. JM]|uniref:CAP domain-containing protein n=1 Tax=Candidatus Electronema sp. JM TaxID=3401571 RepID=UPI003AA9860A